MVLRRLAHFHAFSTLIQRDADETLLDLFPFAVDASVFREQYQARVAVVKAELVRYLVCNKGMVSGDSTEEAADKVERHLQVIGHHVFLSKIEFCAFLESEKSNMLTMYIVDSNISCAL